jgi:hypothetical protein
VCVCVCVCVCVSLCKGTLCARAQRQEHSFKEVHWITHRMLVLRRLYSS